MSKFKIISVPLFQDNYSYIIVSNGVAAFVDAAEKEGVKRAYEKHIVGAGLKLIASLYTHHHHDHYNGEVIADILPKDIDIIGGDDRILETNKKVGNGDEFLIGKAKVKCIFTPCHTKGHICYHVVDDETKTSALMCGDTLFLGGAGRFFEGTAEQMHLALNSKLAGLSDDTLVYAGHEYSVSNLKFAQLVEPENEDLSNKLKWCEATVKEGKSTLPSTIGEEKRYNPFMRVHVAAVKKALKLKEDADEVEVMAVLRESKNKGSL